MTSNGTQEPHQLHRGRTTAANVTACWSLVLVAALATTGLGLAQSTKPAVQTLYAGTTLVSLTVVLLMAIVAACTRKDAPSTALNAVGAGVALWALSDAAEQLQLISQFVSQIVYLSAYLPLFWGVFRLATLWRSHDKIVTALDTTAAVIAVATFAGTLITYPRVLEIISQVPPGLTRNIFLLDTYFPILDAIVIGLGSRALLSLRGQGFSTLALAGGLFVTAGADITWQLSEQTTQTTTAHSPLANFLWLTSYALMAFSVLYRKKTTQTPLRADQKHEFSTMELVLLAISMMIPGLTVLVMAVQITFGQLVIVGIGALCTAGIVTERMRRLLLAAHRTALQLSHLAEQDQLTGLPNRRMWDEQLAAALRGDGPYQGRFWVAVLDLDKFKQYNDTHGHLAGDELLADCARRWQAVLPEYCFLARYGGEEFAVLLPDLEVPAAAMIVDTLRQHMPEGESLSGGLARRAEAESVAQLFSRADAALYRSKQGGRNRITVCDGFDGDSRVVPQQRSGTSRPDVSPQPGSGVDGPPEL